MKYQKYCERYALDAQFVSFIMVDWFMNDQNCKSVSCFLELAKCMVLCDGMKLQMPIPMSVGM